MKDLFGQAILDYQTGNNAENIITETSISEEDVMETAYLFRSYSQMPSIEKKALNLARGRVLDAGCGAGSHSLYLQDIKKLDVTALDISPKAIEACTLRGINTTVCSNILDYNDGPFDTIIMLMNGIGITGRLANLSLYLKKLKALISQNGQVLLDSSDIIYMFDEDEDGGHWIPSGGYYGEITFTISYKGEHEKPFDWLYVDYNTLQNAAYANGLKCELILEGEHFDYLAKLSHL